MSDSLDIAELKAKSPQDLHEMAEELNLQNYSGLRKQDLIFRIEQSLLDSDVILRAEGVKQSQILQAEGQAQAIKEVADAEKFQLLTVAEGEGQAIERVFGAIHNGDPTPDLIAIQYLKALTEVADGQATKLFLPIETAGILGSLGAIGELFNGSGDGDTTTSSGSARSQGPSEE